MTVQVNQTQCCGFKEIDGIEYANTPEETKQALKDVCRDFFDGEDAAFLFFTGVSKERYGQKFKALILKNKLGTIIETKAKRNPNSGNAIKAWVWTVNRKNFKEYAKKHKLLPDNNY